MSAPHGADAPLAPTTGEGAGGLSKKGLSAGTVGLIGAVVIGISCIAPAYTLTAALGPTVSEVGFQVPAIILVGFIPMLLVAFGYRELNRADARLGHLVHVGGARLRPVGRLARRLGPRSPRRSSCCRTSPASPSTSCSC